MGEIEKFNFDGHDFRAVPCSDGEPWFVAADVTKILGYRKPADAVRRLDEDEYASVERESLQVTLGASSAPRGLNPKVTIVNESGLYTLILGSERPEAKRCEMDEHGYRTLTGNSFKAWRKACLIDEANPLTGANVTRVSLFTIDAALSFAPVPNHSSQQ